MPTIYWQVVQARKGWEWISTGRRFLIKKAGKSEGFKLTLHDRRNRKEYVCKGMSNAKSKAESILNREGKYE
jgi:hypothetical protein